MSTGREGVDEIDVSDVTKGTARMLTIKPGETLREDFMQPLGLSAHALAKAVSADNAASS